MFITPEPYKPWKKQWPLVEQQNLNSEVFNNYAPVMAGTHIWQQKSPAGGVLANNYQGENALLADPENFDFRPQNGSPLIDQGRIIPNFTDGYKGRAPDIGAYEYGEKRWIPGYRNFITASEKEITLNESMPSTLMVALAMPPLEQIIVYITPQDKNVNVKKSSQLQFTPQNWMRPQEVTITVDEKHIYKETALIYLTSEGMDTVEIPVKYK